jgi:hypothetical protein
VAEAVRLSAFLGPSVSFNVGSEIETSHGTEDLDSVTRSVGFGGTFGGGVEYLFSSVTLAGEVRYGLGATSIVEDIAGQSVDVKNRGLGVLFGVRLPIGAR